MRLSQWADLIVNVALGNVDRCHEFDTIACRNELQAGFDKIICRNDWAASRGEVVVLGVVAGVIGTAGSGSKIAKCPI